MHRVYVQVSSKKGKKVVILAHEFAVLSFILFFLTDFEGESGVFSSITKTITSANDKHTNIAIPKTHT